MGLGAHSWGPFMFSHLLFVLPHILTVGHCMSHLLSPYTSLSQCLNFPARSCFASGPFLSFRNLCHLLIALDSWGPSLRAQALRESLETQELRP